MTHRSSAKVASRLQRIFGLSGFGFLFFLLRSFLVTAGFRS